MAIELLLLHTAAATKNVQNVYQVGSQDANEMFKKNLIASKPVVVIECKTKNCGGGDKPAYIHKFVFENTGTYVCVFVYLLHY